MQFGKTSPKIHNYRPDHCAHRRHHFDVIWHIHRRITIPGRWTRWGRSFEQKDFVSFGLVWHRLSVFRFLPLWSILHLTWKQNSCWATTNEVRIQSYRSSLVRRDGSDAGLDLIWVFRCLFTHCCCHYCVAVWISSNEDAIGESTLSKVVSYHSHCPIRRRTSRSVARSLTDALARYSFLHGLLVQLRNVQRWGKDSASLSKKTLRMEYLLSSLSRSIQHHGWFLRHLCVWCTSRWNCRDIDNTSGCGENISSNRIGTQEVTDQRWRHSFFFHSDSSSDSIHKDACHSQSHSSRWRAQRFICRSVLILEKIARDSMDDIESW